MASVVSEAECLVVGVRVGDGEPKVKISIQKMSAELTKEQLEEKVQELEQKIRVLEADLIHDALTGLKTRKYFTEEAGKYYEALLDKHTHKRKEWFGFKHLGIIFFDIDHFKKINDTHGHATGDGVLVAVANAIKNGVRSGDIAARWGGEEMVVALLGVDEKGTERKAEMIRKSIEQMSFNNLPDIQVTISAGVAAFEPGITFDEMVQRADKALYEAKESGRNKVVTFSAL